MAEQTEGKKKKTKTILNIAFLVIVFGLTIWSVFRGQDLTQVLRYLGTADQFYVVVSVISVIAFVLGESVIIFYLFRRMEKESSSVGLVEEEDAKVRFPHCCLYSFIGFFYSAITPSASGGQPMQIVYMRKDKLPVAVSTVVLAIITITYKMVLVVFGAFVIILRPAGVMPYLEPVMPIVYLGMGLNVICIALLMLLVFHPSALGTCLDKIIALAGKIRPFKHPDKLKARLARVTEQYNGAADYFRTHIKDVVIVFGITLVQRCILFVITWFTYKAFGLSGHGFFVIVILQGMVSVAVDMLPLPGGMGISENLFLRIFLPIFGAKLTLPGMVISRGISFYTQLIICGIMTVVAVFVIKDKRKK